MPSVASKKASAFPASATLSPGARLHALETPQAQPDASLRNVTVGRNVLREFLGMNLAPNLAANNGKVVRYYDTTDRDAAGDTGETAAEMLARHPGEIKLNLGVVFQVLAGSMKGDYELIPDDITADPSFLRVASVYRTGSQVAGELLDAMLVPVGSPEAARANIRPITDPEPDPGFAIDEVGTYTLGGIEGFYRRKDNGGDYDLPTGPDDDNWHQVAPPIAQQAFFQQITQTEGIALLDDRQVRRNRLYLVTIGPKRVYVRGIDEATFSGPGELIDPANPERTIPVKVDVRAGTIINNQEQLDALGSLFYSPSTISGSPSLAGYNSFQEAIAAIRTTIFFVVFNGTILQIPSFAAGTDIAGYITLYGRHHQVRVDNGDTLTISGSLSLDSIALQVETGGATNGWPLDVRRGYLQGTFTAEASGSTLNGYDTDLSFATLVGTSTSTINLYGSTKYTSAQITAARALGIVVHDLRPVDFNTPTAVRTAVLAGTFTSGELQGTQPADSAREMKFSTSTYGYQYTTGNAGTLVWCRFPKG